MQYNIPMYVPWAELSPSPPPLPNHGALKILNLDHKRAHSLLRPLFMCQKNSLLDYRVSRIMFSEMIFVFRSRKSWSKYNTTSLCMFPGRNYYPHPPPPPPP